MALSQAEINQIVSQVISTLAAANVKISQLPAGAPLAGAEQFEANNGGISVKYTTNEITTFALSTFDLQTAYDGGSNIDISAGSTPFEITGTAPAANELIKIVDDLGREVLIQDRNNPVLKSKYDIELKASGVAPFSVWGNHGAVSMFKWDSTLEAIRAGKVTGTQWDEVNIGSQSYAFGLDVNASGTASGALGNDVSVTGNNSLGIGDGSAPLINAINNYISLLFSGGGLLNVVAGSFNINSTNDAASNIGDIGGGNFVSIGDVGLQLGGTTTRRKILPIGYFDDGGTGSTGIARPYSGVSVITFDDTADDRINLISVAIPFDFDNTDDIQIEITWGPTTTAAGNVKWDIYYQVNPGDDTTVIDPTPPMATATVATTLVAERPMTTIITLGTVALSADVGHRLLFGVVRDTSVGSNYGDVVWVPTIIPTYKSIKA